MKHGTLFVIAALLLAAPAFASHRIFVGGLPWGTTTADVEPLVAPFGPISAISVVCRDRDGEMHVRAIVDFEVEEDAQRAVAALDGLVIAGREIHAEAKKPKEIVVVGSKIKEVIREAGLRSDADLVQAVSDQVHELLAAAIKRAEANKRGTVRPHDL